MFCELRFFWFWFSWLEIVEVRYGKVVWILTVNSRKERGRERHRQIINTREEIEQYVVVYGTLGTTFHFTKYESQMQQHSSFFFNAVLCLAGTGGLCPTVTGTKGYIIYDMNSYIIGYNITIYYKFILLVEVGHLYYKCSF
jgi:hypothetical protein